MALIDTHSHIYLPQFDEDRDLVIKRATHQGIEKIFLPNIDSESIESMLALCHAYPQTCYPMMGLHPTNVKKDFEKELEIVESWCKKEKFIAIGECGIDLYWDKTFITEQKKAFSYQIDLAKKYGLPIVVHARDSFKEIYKILEEKWDNNITGVFHSFTGNLNDVKIIHEFGFMFGINGIITFKNAGLKDVVKHIDITRILLETDSPYLAPIPYRGKRNESCYLIYIAKMLAESFSIPPETLASITTNNALRTFKFLNNNTL